MEQSKFEIGDYVCYSKMRNWRGKIIKIEADYDKNNLLFYKYLIHYRDKMEYWELEMDLEKIDWLLEEL